MNQPRKAYPWWLWFLAELVIFAITSGIANRLTDNKEFSFTWGLSAVLITISLNVVTELRQISDRIEGMSDRLPHKIVSHSAIQAVLLAESFVAIYAMGDPLFTGIAANEIGNLALVLHRLKNGEHKVTGDYVYLTYERLIDSLQNGETYKATTYVDDSFWSTEGGRLFLKANMEAINRGATITRIFFYRRDKTPDLGVCPVVRMHMEARAKLDAGARNRLSLLMLETTGRSVRDMGILRERYLMQITSDAHSEKIDATVITDSNTVRQAQDDWAATCRIAESF